MSSFGKRQKHINRRALSGSYKHLEQIEEASDIGSFMGVSRAQKIYVGRLKRETKKPVKTLKEEERKQ